MNITAKHMNPSRPHPGSDLDSKGRIMVSGTSNDSRYMMSVLLGMWGYDVIEAVGEDETVELAVTGHPQLILLDTSRPFEQELQIIARIRKSELPANLPVIVLSGNTQESYQIAAFEVGANGVLAKPLDLELLEAYLDSSISTQALYST